MVPQQFYASKDKQVSTKGCWLWSPQILQILNFSKTSLHQDFSKGTFFTLVGPFDNEAIAFKMSYGEPSSKESAINRIMVDPLSIITPVISIDGA